MAVEEIVDATENGSADETRQAFAERWESMSEAERAKTANDMFAATRGLNKKVTSLHAEIGALRSQKDSATEVTEKAVSTFDELKNEIAEVRAQKLLVQKQAAMLQRAADHDIDAALAIRFAETADSDGTFELAIAEIERRTQTGINKRLGAVPAPQGSPGEPSRMAQMSPAEVARMPKSMQERYWKQQIEEAVS
jgi:chromosome segregation ATPase